MLNPFTAYTVIIAAATEIGAGPYSPQLGFSTDEDGIEYIYADLCKLMMSIFKLQFQLVLL